MLFIGVVTIWTSSNINWGRERCTRIIKVDGNGYYAYLPAIFIYKDLGFGFFDEVGSREGYQNMQYEYRYRVDGKTVNKYYAGTAAAQLPFFLCAHAVTWLSGLPMDGYSKYYLIFINIASLFYLMMSCYFINKILLLFGISDKNRALVLLSIVFGTNVFYYSVYEPSMSHIYSFAFITLFIYLILHYFRKRSPGTLLLAAPVLGLIAMIRPANLLIVAVIPFLAGDFNSLKGGFKEAVRHWWIIPSSLAFFAIPVLMQLIIYKIQTGNLWVYSYGEERFILSEPHVFSMLFSIRKGLFVYAPLLLVSLGGLYFLFRRNPQSAAYWLGFFLLLTYVLSSWHQWYYGGSFGSRVYVEYYALFAVLLGTLLQNTVKKLPRTALISLIVLLSVYSVIQTYQYYGGIIHWSDMDRDMYREVFLRLK